MAQAESRRSREIMKALRLEGWFCFKVHGNEFMMAGLPDVMVCAEGHFIALETKEPGKRTHTSVRQDYVMGQIIEAGGATKVVVTPTEAVAFVKKVLATK